RYAGLATRSSLRESPRGRIKWSCRSSGLTGGGDSFSSSRPPGHRLLHRQDVPAAFAPVLDLVHGRSDDVNAESADRPILDREIEVRRRRLERVGGLPVIVDLNRQDLALDRQARGEPGPAVVGVPGTAGGE